MAIVLRNALLADIDPISVASGELRIEDGLIAERGETVAQRVGDEVVDCGDCVVMPGMVNGHTHLYSALAVGMPPPLQAPQTFLEILQFVWWRLDRALDADGQWIDLARNIYDLDLTPPMAHVISRAINRLDVRHTATGYAFLVFLMERDEAEAVRFFTLATHAGSDAACQDVYKRSIEEFEDAFHHWLEIAR